MDFWKFLYEVLLSILQIIFYLGAVYYTFYFARRGYANAKASEPPVVRENNWNINISKG